MLQGPAWPSLWLGLVMIRLGSCGCTSLDALVDSVLDQRRTLLGTYLRLSAACPAIGQEVVCCVLAQLPVADALEDRWALERHAHVPMARGLSEAMGAIKEVLEDGLHTVLEWGLPWGLGAGEGEGASRLDGGDGGQGGGVNSGGAGP